MPKSWEHARGMETMQKAWGPLQRHGDHAKGMGTMPMAWRLVRLEGDKSVGNRGTFKHFFESSTPICSKWENGFGGGLGFPNWVFLLHMVWWHSHVGVTNFNV